MKKCMIQIILILFCLMGYLAGSAQSDFIVLINSDTLYGQVAHFNYGANQRIQLIDNTKKKSAYTLMQVKGFRMKDEIYHLVKFQDTYTYMKLITPGYLSLYNFQIENQVSWDGRYLLKLDGRGIEVPNIGFKKRITDFVSDCYDLAEKVSAGTYGRNDIDKIVAEYNACITTRTETKTVTAKPDVPLEQMNAWTKLEAAVQETDQLADKDTILEMIAEIKSKKQRQERIPNFLSEGLKKSLEGHSELLELLIQALDAGN